MGTLTLMKNGHRQMTFEDLKGLRAEGYIRDSTLDQKDGFGPELQRRAIDTFARSYGLMLGEALYTDFITGTSTLKRSGFQQALQDAQVDRFDVLLVYHTSRFARNRADAIEYKRKLAALGKAIVFVSQGILSGRDQDFLNEGINEVLDEHYSRNVSRWTADGMRAKYEEGFANGRPPLGYRSEKLANGKRERKVPDPETMPILLDLLRCYATGHYSAQALADHLNGLGHRNRMGRPFSSGSVRSVLEDRCYEGLVVWHPGKPEELVRDGGHQVPPEVKALWLGCQEVQAHRTTPWSRGPRAQARVYLFSGILVCESCGGRYKGLALVRHRKLHQRLGHQRRACPVRPQSLAMEALSQQFANRVLPLLHLGEDFIARVTRSLAQRDREGAQPVQEQGPRLEHALEQLRKQHQWGDLTDEAYLRERDALRYQIQALKARAPLADVPNMQRAAELLSRLPALWQHPGVEDRQRQDLLRETFEEVRIMGKELVAIRPRPEYAPHFAYLTLWQMGCPTSTHGTLSGVNSGCFGFQLHPLSHSPPSRGRGLFLPPRWGKDRMGVWEPGGRLVDNRRTLG